MPVAGTPFYPRENYSAECAPQAPLSPFEHLEATANAASDVALRVTALADRLLGCEPCAAGCTASGLSPGALLSRMRSADDQICDALSTISTALSRIENAIS